MHEIGTEAFHDCKYVTEVRLPESLETINSSAFEGCSALEKIELPDNIEQIGMYAFEDCTALKSVKLPARLTDIDQAVFAMVFVMFVFGVNQGMQPIAEILCLSKASARTCFFKSCDFSEPD